MGAFDFLKLFVGIFIIGFLLFALAPVQNEFHTNVTTNLGTEMINISNASAGTQTIVIPDEQRNFGNLFFFRGLPIMVLIGLGIHSFMQSQRRDGVV